MGFQTLQWGIMADLIASNRKLLEDPAVAMICVYGLMEPSGPCSLEDMIELALFLKGAGYRPQQVQDFIPAPFDIATCMYYTGIDPFTRKPVYVARQLRDRKLQRALMQFFKPENYFEVRKALEQAGRQDLIGSGCDCLIRAQPPKEAIDARRLRANELVRSVFRVSGEDCFVAQVVCRRIEDVNALLADLQATRAIQSSRTAFVLETVMDKGAFGPVEAPLVPEA